MSCADKQQPIQFDDFLGLGREVFDRTRLIILTGISGSGKTTIAMRQVAMNSKEAIGGITWEMLLELPKTVKALLIALFSVLVIGFCPTRVEQVSKALRDRPFRYSFSGVIATVIVSGLIGLLAFSIILLPIAGILAAWFLMVWLLGFVAMCYSIGMKMCESSLFQLPDAIPRQHAPIASVCAPGRKRWFHPPAVVQVSWGDWPPWICP